MLTSMLDSEDLEPSGLRRLRRSEYHELGKLGVFDDERVELLRGQLVSRSVIGARHRRLTVWMTRRLVEMLDRRFDVYPGQPFAASEDSEPEPDLMVIDAGLPDLDRDHPSSALLVMELSDSSIRKDRNIKLPIYAEAGVPEYWIIDLSRDGELVVEVYTDRTPQGYATMTTLRDGDVLRPKLVPIEIPIADLPR